MTVSDRIDYSILAVFTITDGLRVDKVVSVGRNIEGTNFEVYVENYDGTETTFIAKFKGANEAMVCALQYCGYDELGGV